MCVVRFDHVSVGPLQIEIGQMLLLEGDGRPVEP